MKNRLVLFIAVLFVGLGLLLSCDKKEAAKEVGVYYTCPMHPEIKKDVAGQCPVCGMDLVKKEDPDHKH
jgi:membrane fusion protein, copper/silver efflux system